MTEDTTPKVELVESSPDHGPPLIPVEYRTPWGNTLGGVILAGGISLALLTVALGIAYWLTGGAGW